MAAYFKIVETPNPEKDGTQQPYHVRFSSKGTLKTKELVEEVSYGTTYTESDVYGMLSLLNTLLTRKLSAGYNVELTGIGVFTLSLQCPPEKEKKKIGAHNVTLRSIKFRPSKDLVKKVAQRITFQKRPEKDQITYTIDQRKAFLQHYLAKHLFITAKCYRQQTHLSKTAASIELKQFIQEGWILREGKGPTTFYRLKEEA
ncbi:MAG: HU family DNA-binding protein [Tannerellaceae bacterium]|nr:HU family DNA-binding protein [Tannerellaceae bacterium]